MHSFRSNNRGPSPIRLGLLAFSLSILVLPAVAEAAVLCGRRNSTTGQLAEGAALHVRSTCRAKEVQATLTALGLESTFTVRAGSPITTNGTVSTPANCDAGEVATGGGGLSVSAAGGSPAIRSSRPQPDTAGAVPTAWRVTVANQAATGTITVTPYAVCAGP